MESEGGEDLSYFWRGWYFNNWQLDMAVSSAEFVDGDAAKGVKVTVTNYGQLVMPATLRVALKDGSHVDVSVPAETWMQQSSHVFTVPTTSPAVSATLDPDRIIPDKDRSNNSVSLHP
jgi:archaellum component FlaF (FlaF/FlaG flagellin family)